MFALTVLTNLMLAVEVGVALAALLMVKRISGTPQIAAVDKSTETEGSHHSFVGREILPGVLFFRVFSAFFFGVVDKLDDELKRAKQEPDILILRVRKVLEKAGFLDRLGRENVCPNIAASLARVRVILGLPPEPEANPLHQERQQLERCTAN